MVLFCLVWLDLLLYGMMCFCLVLYDLVQFSMVQYSLLWFDMGGWVDGLVVWVGGWSN